MLVSYRGSIYILYWCGSVVPKHISKVLQVMGYLRLPQKAQRGHGKRTGSYIVLVYSTWVLKELYIHTSTLFYISKCFLSNVHALMTASGATMDYTCMYYVICIMFPNFGACGSSYLIVNRKKENVTKCQCIERKSSFTASWWLKHVWWCECFQVII